VVRLDVKAGQTYYIRAKLCLFMDLKERYIKCPQSKEPASFAAQAALFGMVKDSSRVLLDPPK